MLAELCPPALIYLIFSLTQIVIDTIKGFYNTAFLKIWVTFAFTILLNTLCKMNLGIVSWIIVFIPFILMTLIISILLIMFGLDPSTGRSKVYKASSATRRPEKLIGGCGGTQFGCCADGTIPAKSLNDPCKDGPAQNGPTEQEREKDLELIDKLRQALSEDQQLQAASLIDQLRDLLNKQEGTRDHLELLYKLRQELEKGNTAEANELINNEVIHGGMIPKVKTCIDAINNGVRAVVIIDGRKPH